jgi:hypothetical protein
MPEQAGTAAFLRGKPIPLDLAPKLVSEAPDLLFQGVVLIEKLPCVEETLGEVCRFDQIGPVIVLAEGDGFAGFPVDPMGEHTVEPVRFVVEEF